MSYIGQAALKTTNIKRFDVTGSTSATHVLSWTAPSEQTLWITINGVKQQDDAYTIAGSPTTITLSSALVSADKMEVIGVVDMGVSTYPVDGSVSTASLGNTSVTTAKIAADAVTATEIATGAVGTTEIAANAVDTSEIAADAVGLTEMAGLARGKLIVGDSSGNPSALTVGTTGQYLTSDGTDASWGAVVSLPTQTSNAGKLLFTDGTDASWVSRPNKNYLINGQFDVWQRGTSFVYGSMTAHNYYMDRWRHEGAGWTGSVTQQTFTNGQTDVPSNPTYYARWIISAVNAGGVSLMQRMENYPLNKMSGKTVTVSVWLRSVSGTIAAGDITIYGGGALGAVGPTWTKYTKTATLATQGGAYGPSYGITVATTVLLTSGIDIANFQVEDGSVATDFEQKPFGETLVQCQRYYYEADTGFAAYGTNAVIGRNHPVQMRATPTMTWFYAGQSGTAWKVYNILNAAQNTMSANNNIFMSKDGLKWWYNLDGSYAGWSGNGTHPAGISTYIKMDAEL